MGHLMRCGYSCRRSCRVSSLSRSTLRHKAELRAERDNEVVEQIKRVVKKHRRYGCPRVYAQLRRQGLLINRKRVHRLWKKEGFSLRRKGRRKRHIVTGQERVHKAEYPNHIWTYDFIEDRTAKGNRLRILSVLDEFHRECLCLRVERSFPASKVIETLEFLFLLKGRPMYLRSDNGPEFIAKAVKGWLGTQEVKPVYIEPGSPWQNGFVESFHDKLRDECLNQEIFANTSEARALIETWREYYNNERLHSGLGYRTPAEFAAQFNKQTEPILSS